MLSTECLTSKICISHRQLHGVTKPIHFYLFLRIREDCEITTSSLYKIRQLLSSGCVYSHTAWPKEYKQMTNLVLKNQLEPEVLKRSLRKGPQTKGLFTWREGAPTRATPLTEPPGEG